MLTTVKHIYPRNSKEPTFVIKLQIGFCKSSIMSMSFFIIVSQPDLKLRAGQPNNQLLQEPNGEPSDSKVQAINNEKAKNKLMLIKL